MFLINGKEQIADTEYDTFYSYGQRLAERELDKSDIATVEQIDADGETIGVVPALGVRLLQRALDDGYSDFNNHRESERSYHGAYVHNNY